MRLWIRAPGDPEGPNATIDIDLSQGEAPNQSIVIILGLTVLSVAPSILSSIRGGSVPASSARPTSPRRW